MEPEKRKQLRRRLAELREHPGSVAGRPGIDLLGGLLDQELADLLEQVLADPPSDPQPQPAYLRQERARQRVVVTGMGAVTPLGLTAAEFWAGAARGQSGIGPITLFDASRYPSRIAGEVKGFDPRNYIEARESRRMSRPTQMAVAASRMAVEDAGLALNGQSTERIGVLLGTGVGSFGDTEAGARLMLEKGGDRLSPLFVPIILANMPACQVTIQLGIRGYSSTIVTACAAGAQAIGEAANVIERGDADVMLAGGTEASICELGLAGFCAMRALSTRNHEPERASRPFDLDRDGFVPAEGSGVLVLESLEHAMARGARIYAELLGYGCSADAYHVVAPAPEADGAARAMEWALRSAGVAPEAVDYINAHGTSTDLNDVTETRAIKRALGEHAYQVAISSTKSMIGHLLGAAGAVEAIATVNAIYHQLIPPTANYEVPDPRCDLDYVPSVARPRRVRVALSNSFGFGGQNACLVFRQFENADRDGMGER